MIVKNPVTTSGPNRGCDAMDTLVNYSIGAAGVLLAGTPLLRDVTQLAAGILPYDYTLTKTITTGAATDRGVLATTTGAGDLIGVFQGVGDTAGRNYTSINTVTSVYSAPCRVLGQGVVLAGAVAAGTAVTVGSRLIVSSANVFATVGTPAIGTYVGRVVAYVINTRVPLAIAAGAQTVTPSSMAGINVGSSLTIDVGTGVQETVVVTAVAATTFTATFATAHNAGAIVQGITQASGASILTVPGSGNNTGLVWCDIKACA